MHSIETVLTESAFAIYIGEQKLFTDMDKFIKYGRIASKTDDAVVCITRQAFKYPDKVWLYAYDAENGTEIQTMPFTYDESEWLIVKDWCFPYLNVA